MIDYTGKIVRLRPLKLSDKDYSIKWRNDPNIRENALGYRFPVTEAMEEKWYEDALKDQNNSRIIYAIEDIEDSKLVGFVQLNRIDWISRTAYFGISIGDKEKHGKGIAPDSMHILFKYAFECLDIRKIYAEIVDFNEKSKKLHEEFGFKIEGHLKKHIYLNNKYHDLSIVAIYKEDYYSKYKDLK